MRMKQCAICGKKYALVWRLAKLRGKYNPTIKRKQRPNFQWTRLPSEIKAVDGKAPLKGKRVLACAK